MRHQSAMMGPLMLLVATACVSSRERDAVGVATGDEDDDDASVVVASSGDSDAGRTMPPSTSLHSSAASPNTTTQETPSYSEPAGTDPVDWQNVDILFEQDLTPEQRAEAKNPEFCLSEVTCGTAPSQAAILEAGQAAIEFAKNVVAAEMQVDLYWLTQQQSVAEDSFVDPHESFSETLSIAVQPRGPTIVHRCGGQAFVPMIVKVRSSMTGIDGTGVGYLGYPSGVLQSFIDPGPGVAIFDASGVNTHYVASYWDEFRETWNGDLYPTDSFSYDYQADAGVSRESPEPFSRGRFPVACDGVEQVPVTEAGGFVAARDLQRLTNELGLMPVTFEGLGTTRLALRVSELLSETTCLGVDSSSFPARLSLTHAGGAEHVVDDLLWFTPCTPRAINEDPVRADDCVRFKPRVRLELLPGSPLADVLASDLGIELTDDTLNPYSMFCELLLNVTAEGAEPSAESLCRLFAATETDGSWDFSENR